MTKKRTAATTAAEGKCVWFIRFCFLLWVSDPMTRSWVYQAFKMFFFGYYLSFPCAPVCSCALLCITVSSCAFPCVLSVLKSASFGKYLPIACNPVCLLWPKIGFCWWFANPVYYQWPESAFVGHSFVLWVRFVQISMPLSGIFIASNQPYPDVS